MTATHLITGAFGYSGARIAKRLLDRGDSVRTLTCSPDRQHALRGRVAAFPMDFGDRAGIRAALAGVEVLFNTYWIRFTRAGFRQSDAVRNTRTLFESAREAGVRRIVHVSITNPSPDSPYEYFRGKAELEAALAESGVPHSILRPAVLFGGRDILINNIAWMVRRLPVVGVFGDGRYRLRPIHVEDLAALAVREAGCEGSRRVDAVGTETFTYRDLVARVAEAVGKKPRLVSVPASLGLCASWLLGLFLHDVVLTRQEIGALMDGLLTTEGPGVGTRPLSGWLVRRAEDLGRRYANELSRRRDRVRSYEEL